MSIAGESPDLKKINYLQPIMEKLLQPEIDPAREILPYAKTAYNYRLTGVFLYNLKT